MNLSKFLSPFERFVLMLQGEMTEPEPWGLFHLVALTLTIAIIGWLWSRAPKHSEEQLKAVLGTYSVIALILEIGKQIIWSFSFDAATQTALWDYTWYAAPFQLCTTPMYVCLVCLAMRKSKLRDSLLSYVAYITILGSFAMMMLPADCFTSDILVNIHTTYLHFGSFVVSVYLLMSKEVQISREALLRAISIFICFVCAAMLLNEFVYTSGILQGETFNMFYISPYFVSSLPVFNTIQPLVPHFAFILIYVTALSTGGFVIYNIAFACDYVWQRLTVPTLSRHKVKYFH